MLHIKLDKTSHHPPYYLQILEQIREAILSGELSFGTRLPSTRQLAIELGVARRTLILAYEELCEQGFCTSRVGQGTFVKEISTFKAEHKTLNSHTFPKWLSDNINTFTREPDYQGKICFTPSLVNTEMLPLSTMRQVFQEAFSQASSKLGQFKKSNGDLELIQSICQYVLPSRGIYVEPDHVLITPGVQYSSLLTSILVAPYGGEMSYGVPGYLDIPKHFIQRGITGIPCPVDEEGVRLTQEAAKARLHYVMPEHHFPQGVTLSPSRRDALLQLAEENDALILEDDYDSEFYYERHPLPALKACDSNGRVIYLGTFSKTLFNGLRLGYVVAHPDIIRRLTHLHWQFSRGTSLVLQIWATELLRSGMVERHLRRMRIYYRKNRDLVASYLQAIFPEWSWNFPKGGLHFWIKLPPHELAETLIHKASEKGVGLWSGAKYYEYMTGDAANRLILGFSALTEPEIHQAFSKLRTLSPKMLECLSCP
jgi:GntR family transcriptional regulator/MocR family aminotransferase